MNSSVDIAIIISIVVAVSTVAAGVSILNWREGLLFVMVIGILQDPMRKLTAGTPAMFILWSAAIFMFVAFCAWQRRGVAKFSTLFLLDRSLGTTWMFFGFVLGVQCLNALFRWGPMVPVLGMIEYFIPIGALLVGVGFSEKPQYRIRFLKRYVWLVTPVALTIYLSVQFSDSWYVLKDVGYFTDDTLPIYDFGTVVDPYSGLFRTGEIGAWHAATAAMFLIILAQYSGKRAIQMLGMVLVVLLIGAILYTGRRKMLMALTLFFMSYSAALFVLRAKYWNLVLTALPVILIGSYLFLAGDLEEGDVEGQSVHLMRGATVYSGTGERFDTSLNLLQSAMARSNGVGLGVGVYAQSARYAGVDVSGAVGGAGEAGIGKIVLELGVIGAIALILIMAWTTWRAFIALRHMVHCRDPMAHVACGLASFLIAQIATFAVATQLYGDPFILTIVGITSGILLSLLQASLRQKAADRAKRAEMAKMARVQRVE